MVFTTRYSGGKGGRNHLEHALRELNVAQKNGQPNHPQTQGKVERFQQTLKKWLRARRAPQTLTELQELLDQFQGYYNEHRRHSAIGRRTPLEVWNATVKARPASHPLPNKVEVLHVHTQDSGNITVGPWTVGLGRRYDWRPITAIRDDLTLSVFENTELLATWTITDPSKHYQSAPTTRNPTGKRRPKA